MNLKKYGKDGSSFSCIGICLSEESKVFETLKEKFNEKEMKIGF
jgi:hypothetical protein